MEAAIQSIRFNSNITDEQLWEFFGSWPIVDIVRGSWMSHVYFFADEPTEGDDKGKFSLEA